MITKAQIEYNLTKGEEVLARLSERIEKLKNDVSLLTHSLEVKSKELRNLWEKYHNVKRMKNLFQVERDFLFEKLLDMTDLSAQDLIYELKTIPEETFIRLRKGYRRNSKGEASGD